MTKVLYIPEGRYLIFYTKFGALKRTEIIEEGWIDEDAAGLGKFIDILVKYLNTSNVVDYEYSFAAINNMPKHRNYITSEFILV